VTDNRRTPSESADIALLFEVSEVLAATDDLRDVLDPVVNLVADRLGLLRVLLTLHNRVSAEIVIEAAHGITPGQQRRGRYLVGEGITGRVVQTGETAIVPRIADEPGYLHRTNAPGRTGAHVAFVCVPIKLGSEVIGTLGAYRQDAALPGLDLDARLLAIVATMVAQAVSLRQTTQEHHQRLLEENARLQAELANRFRPQNIIGTSKAMQNVYDLIWRVAKSEATVLILGESGVGKELVAHAIHYNSPRAGRPFVRVNCAALPESVIESELFGHERGAFTGAIAARKGRFELAEGGTLFLDEVGDLSPGTQVKLLRVLQEREFERVGGTRTIRANVRIVTATNTDLETMMHAGEFRADLFYRLNIFPIRIPPLRERKSDILLLTDHFVGHFGEANTKNIRRVSTPAIDMLIAYHWPGNVRELENCIERAVLLSTDDVIHGHHLPPTLQTAEASDTGYTGTLQGSLDALEREVVVDALKSARGNMAAAARALGLTERKMGLRVAKHTIDPRRFRSGAE
jgi:Nif-specific regulatory protein